MTHLDLFSGIGGFALSAQTVWGSDYHCVGFCEIDPFCQQVLRKNFKGVNIYGDIRTLSAERLIADANGNRQPTRGDEINTTLPGQQTLYDGQGCNIDLLTGGFPCQPFSTAGKRKGKEDDRYLWPEMLRVIREVKPRWVIGENVAGIVEMALGQVCADLEGLGYEVQCFIIPACSVNAPHRRDRVWIVANSNREGFYWEPETIKEIDGAGGRISRRETSEQRPGEFPESRTFPDWSRDWREVAALTCVHRMDDGVSTRVAGLPNRVKGGYRTIPGGEEGQRLISESKWRQEALKCYGNSIVPQVAMELMKAIKEVEAAEAAIALAEAA